MIKSADNFYYLYSKDTRALEGFTGIKYLSEIIKITRCVPKESIFAPRPRKTIIYHKWYDEFNSSLILKDKKVKILINDINTPIIHSKDTYGLLPINDIIKMSKLMFVSINNEGYHLLSFLGIDNYLRTFYYDDEWLRCSSLLLGIHNLQFLIKERENTFNCEVPAAKVNGPPCQGDRSWLSCLPVSGDLRRELETVSNLSFSILKQ